MKAPPPIQLTPNGRGTVLAGLLIVGCGVVAAIPMLSLWGQIVLAAVVLAYPLTLRAAVLSRPERLLLTCEPPVGPGGGIVTGDTLELRVTLSNLSAAPISRARIQVVHGQSLEFDSDALSIAVGAESQSEWRLTGRALWVGPAFIHGFHLSVGGPFGFFQCRNYRPLSIEMSVLPRSAATGKSRRYLRPTAADRNAVSTRTSNLRGMSSDIRELREHVPGDPFKNIAWKATARARKLIVKEFESEENLSVYTLLDMGSSMRWGTPGETRLDAGIDLCFHLARTVAAQHGRFGLLSYGQELFGLTRATSGMAMPRQVMEHLLELNSVVHERFTDLSLSELVHTVAEFLRTQDDLDFSLPEIAHAMGQHAVAPYDTEAIYAYVSRYLHERGLSTGAPYLIAEPSSDPVQSRLRSFCRVRGIELPYRLDTIQSARELEFSRAIQRAVTLGGGPHTLIVVSDLVGVRDIAAFMSAVGLARSHKHRLIFFCHDGPGFDGPMAEDSLADRLHGLYAEQLRTRRNELQEQLRKSRVSVRSVGVNAA